MLEKDKCFIMYDFKTWGEAKDLLVRMRNMCVDYKKCYVGDMYDLLGLVAEEGVPHNSFWMLEDLDNALIAYDNDRQVYIIQFPLPMDNVEPAKETKPDMVAHPPHYQTASGLETIDVIEAFTSELKGIEATDTGNVIKYICRWGKKNGLEDLEKAQWYLNHLINKVKERLKKEKMQHE